MAARPIFIPVTDGKVYVKTQFVTFKWFAGMSAAQKKKSVASLHEASLQSVGVNSVLEISSKSEESLGIALSAFNLKLNHPQTGNPLPLECAFQGSKVFEEGGPYTDLFNVSPREAKRDPRLQSSGRLVAFRFDGEDWPLEPQTGFYDWLYINALIRQPQLAERLLDYSAFTDIEFNPDKSINCQAYSAALYVSLSLRGLLRRAATDKKAFLAVLDQVLVSNARQDDSAQGSLF